MMLMVTRPDKGSFTVASFIDLDILDILRLFSIPLAALWPPCKITSCLSGRLAYLTASQHSDGARWPKSCFHPF